MAKLSMLRRGLTYRLQNDLVTIDKEPETIVVFVALWNKLDTSAKKKGRPDAHAKCPDAGLRPRRLMHQVPS